MKIVVEKILKNNPAAHNIQVAQSLRSFFCHTEHSQAVIYGSIEGKSIVYRQSKVERNPKRSISDQTKSDFTAMPKQMAVSQK